MEADLWGIDSLRPVRYTYSGGARIPLRPLRTERSCTRHCSAFYRAPHLCSESEVRAEQSRDAGTDGQSSGASRALHLRTLQEGFAVCTRACEGGRYSW